VTFGLGRRDHPAPGSFVNNFIQWILDNYAKAIVVAKQEEDSEDDINDILDWVEIKNKAFRGSSVRLPTAEEVRERANVFQGLIEEEQKTLASWCGESVEFQRSFSTISLGRYVFRTEQNLLRLGPESIREGDEL